MDKNDTNFHNNKEDSNIGKLFLNKYNCIQKIGKVSFGTIYKVEYNGNYYAAKLEKIDNELNFLENEVSIMNYLKGPNIPYIIDYDSDSNYNILVMQLLGKSLDTLLKDKKQFSLKTVCMIGYQIISILEYIHNRHIIHRDIKPDNFVMGLNELSQYVYLLDFGLAKKYRSSKSLEQIPFVYRNKIIGTARYSSINALKGYEQSRRDDLEAVGYILIYFFKGILPWQGLHAKNKEEKYSKILQKKIEISPEELCNGLPEEFEKFIKYVKNLEYLEQPDYEMMRGYFNSMLRKENNKFDYIYDWTTYEERRKRRVITPRSELSSIQNKKTTNVTNKHLADTIEDNNDDLNNYLTLRKNKGFNNNIIKEEINQSNNSIINLKNNHKNGENKEEEQQINISKIKKYHLNNTNNNKEETVCCSSGCIII